MTWIKAMDALTGAALIEHLRNRQKSFPKRPDGEAETPSYECHLCQDEELVFVTKRYADIYPDREDSPSADLPYTLAAPCSCIEWKAMTRLFKSSQITDKMAEKSFANFSLEGVLPPVQAAYKCAKEYLERFDQLQARKEANGLFLGGVSGSGKTHLCLAVVNALLDRGVSVLYFPFVEGMQEVKHNFNSDDAANKEKESRLQRVPVLYVDDLFKAKKGNEPTGMEIKFMFQVLNYRDLNGLPTIFSTEASLNQLLYWDAAVGSRIAKMTQDYQVLIQGDMVKLNKRLPSDA